MAGLAAGFLAEDLAALEAQHARDPGSRGANDFGTARSRKLQSVTLKSRHCEFN